MKYAIYGYGGHAREVASYMDMEIEFFVDDEYANENTKSIKDFNPLKYQLMIAIADPILRKNIVNNLPKNTKYFSYTHPTSIIGPNVEIGQGSFVGPNCILTTDIRIGSHCILNRGNHIGHDTVIGEYFSAMPGSIISGNVKIGNFVYIGTNSSVKEKISICNNVIIGLNSGVVKNISQEGVYVGTPIKKIK